MTTEEQILAVEEYRTNCNGFDTVYKHSLRPKVVYSEGVKFVAETCEAYWLIDVLYSHITPRLLADGFAVMTLKLNKTGSGAKFEANDGGKGKAKRLAVQNIPFTDFPVREIKFFIEGTDDDGYVLMLAEER